MDKYRKELEEGKKKQEDPDIWNDLDAAQKLNKEVAKLQVIVDEYDKLEELKDEVFGLIELIEESEDVDEELNEELSKTMGKLQKRVEEYNLKTMLKGKYDSCNAILTLHAGAGGTEACDWTSILYRMYTRFVERFGYTSEELDKLDGDEAGIKSITFRVEGENAYGYLKAEMGVHRLVRISPFDSNARRHTSFASLEVTPEIEDDGSIELRQDEIKMDVFRSSGAGGQHVNKTSSAVRLTHIPTGIIVSCQNERSQVQNREMCMKMLRSKLIEKRERENIEKMQEITGDLKKIEWGSQIRSYVFQPYTLVKDHRTGYENGNIQAVMDGDIQGFIFDYLRKS